MAYNKSERPDSPMKRRGGRQKKKSLCILWIKKIIEIRLQKNVK